MLSTIAAVGLAAALPLLAGCASGMTSGEPAGVAAARQDAAAPKPAAAKPAAPKQFAQVPLASWDLNQPLVGRELECDDGKIAMLFDCRDMVLLAFLPADSIGGATVTDIWGWSDSTTGREFALVGRTGGTSFIEITDPLNPRYLGELPYHSSGRASRWRDIRVYKNHAFVVSDNAGRHGMQVFDLTQLRDVQARQVFQETAFYDRIGSAHNVALNEATGFAYIVGAGGSGETCGGGLHMVDVRTPRTPTFVGCHAVTGTGRRGTGYVHDTQCTIYRGPDQAHRGKEICFNAAETALSIVDVTDKHNPVTLSVATYPNVAYAHQGSLSKDHRYFFLGDELDEVRSKFNTRTLVFDLKDLDDPTLAKEFFGTTAATDHNVFVRGSYLFQSNYKAGIRVLDVSTPADPREVAYFDTSPMVENAPLTNEGSWGNFPYFDSGVVAVTSKNEGFYLLRHTPSPPAN